MNENVFNVLMAHDKFETIRTNIIIITANDSNLKHIPDISCFTNLISIDLGQNCLKSLPIFPNSLEELIIDNNLVEIIEHMPNIKRIRAKRNMLKNIKYSKSMESLCLSHNPNLVKITQLPKLYHLEIKNTGIVEIPPCTNLKYLDIGETSIKSLPNLPMLYILSCVRSDIYDISRLTALYSLRMADSNIRTLHYIPTLQTMSYNGDHKKQLKLSSRYKARHVVQNRNNIIEYVFTDKLVRISITE